MAGLEQDGGGAPELLAEDWSSVLGDSFPGLGFAEETEDESSREAPAAPAATSTTTSAPATTGTGDAAAAEPPAPSGSPGTTAATPPSDADEADGDAGSALTYDPALLEGLTPHQYTVRGEARTVDGMLVLPTGEGAIIDAEALPALSQRLAERDELEQLGRALYEENQTYGRLATWTRPGANGQPETLTGLQALEAMHTDNATKDAIIATLMDTFRDPGQLANFLVPTGVAPDGVTPQFAFHPAALQSLANAVKAARAEAMMTAGRRFQGLVQAPAPSPEAPLPPATQHPAVVRDYATRNGVVGLTGEDEAALAQQLPVYVRPATATDVQQNPTLREGQPVIDGRFLLLMQDRAATRAASAKQLADAGRVAQENARRLANATPPRKAAAPATPTNAQKPTAQQAKEARVRSLWEMQESAAAHALR